ncbi:MAG: beta-galactosidase [Acidobacteriaceae bacterium]
MAITRREMLQGLGMVSASVGANRLRLLPAAVSLSGNSGEPQFAMPEIIRYDAQCFTIHGRDTFLYSACMHYPRTPKDLWRDRLGKLKQAGFNTIETYVFWNYHEPVEGQVDMTELEDFVRLVHEMGFWLIARVGPYACAEWDAGGFPHWLIEKQFALRSDAPQSVASSQSWYNHVLPIVRDNMITRGGPVVLIQIENEYDYWDLPGQQKLAYLTALAKMVWNAGIDIPIITNWAQQARDKSDPVMARITDTCDFYPRWNIAREVPAGLAKLRRQQPGSPLCIAELQGGWFSQFGGELSVDQEGVSGAQLNALTKTAMECGTTCLSFYMGHGGTNFDWAARNLTTTYDYAAPVRETGGLWDKYYAARRIGAFLNQVGPLLARSQGASDTVSSDNPDVSVTLRLNGARGILFLRNNADGDQSFHLRLTGAGSGTNLALTVPRAGELSISRRGMKLLVWQMPLPGAHIHYCTAEILIAGNFGQRSWTAVCDDPGNLVEISLAADEQPAVEGELLYQSYDAGQRIMTLGFSMGTVPKYLLVGGALQIIALPTALAARVWTMPLPTGTDDNRQPSAKAETPVITDCSLLRSSSAGANSSIAELEYAPGEHDLTILALAAPRQCTIDGNSAPMSYNSRLQSASVRVSTPPLPFQPLDIVHGEYRVERFAPTEGEWVRTRPVPLERLGAIPYGYVKYRAAFAWSGEEQLFVDSFTRQPRQVFLNGTRVAELSRDDRALSVPLAGRARSGENLLEISYEAFGSANFGPEMADLTGIQSIRTGSQTQAAEIAELEIQRVPAAMRGRNVDPSYASNFWQPVTVDAGAEAADLLPAYTWFRARFPLAARSEWACPWNVAIASDRDALLYVNGKFVGFYRTIGPQTKFYLPEPYLHLDGERQNILTVVLAYTDNIKALTQLTIAPECDVAVRKTRVQFAW